MTPAQRAVAERVVAEEVGKRETLVISLCGAHAYGFASVDSDLDLKGVWAAPSRRLLGLAGAPGGIDRHEWLNEIEVDFTVNELAQAVRGVLKGNGNMLERIMDIRPLYAAPELAELRMLARQNLSRRAHAHYRGFSFSQREAVDLAAPKAKKVLYVLRTAVTGAHLLETGEVVPDLSQLHRQYGFPEVPELIAIKREAEQGVLPAAWIDKVPGLFERAFARLERALERSILPEQPPAEEALERWLIDYRVAALGRGQA
jgi:predicted nucleotidyltransferase